MERKIERIFVHCTASPQSWTEGDLRAEFKRKGWQNPGYHYAIDREGQIIGLLDESKVSNGVRGYNATAINVAYIGGIDHNGKGVDNRTPEQKKALIALLKKLKRKYPAAHILGHRDIWGKSPAKWHKLCPCFDAEEEYKSL